MKWPPPTRAPLLLAAALLICEAGATQAGVCDYRPSQLMNGAAATSVAATGAATAGAGVGLKALGFYTLVHSKTGLTMLGYVAPGAKAVILPGLAGFVPWLAGVLMSPPAIIGGAATAVGIGALEGVCWFGDERVTDYDEVVAIMRSMADHADPAFFRLVYDAERDGWAIRVWDPEEKRHDTLLVRNLYIANGVLKHRDWGLNTVIGRVGFVPTAEADSAARPAED